MAAVVTQNGLVFAVQRCGGAGGPSFGSTPGYIGWGTGSGGASPTATALFTELVTGRLAATLSQLTTSVSGDTAYAVATYTAPVGVTLTNAGLFDALSGGSLLAMTDFDGVPVTLATGDTLTVGFPLQIL